MGFSNVHVEMHRTEYRHTQLESFSVLSVRLLQSLPLVHQLHFGTLGMDQC